MISSDGNHHQTANAPLNQPTISFNSSQPIPSPPQAPEPFHPTLTPSYKKSGKPKLCHPAQNLCLAPFQTSSSYSWKSKSFCFTNRQTLHFLWSHRKWFSSVFPLQFASPCLGSLCSTTLLWQPARESTVLTPKTDPLWSLSISKVSSCRWLPG
jgi:hypothetical protein